MAIKSENRWIDRVLPAEMRKRFLEGLRNPKAWLRGEGIPEDNITPWELLLYFFHRAFSGMFDGFVSKQDFLYKERFRIPPNSISVAGVVSSVWDAVNDPLIGTWMDRKRFGAHPLRVIMRISAITGSVLSVVKLFDGGMSPWQHLAVLMICNMSQDILTTMKDIADKKLRSGISPSSQQRSRIDVWGAIGASLTWGIGNLPTVLMSFRGVFGFDDYQIIFFGACVLLPFGIAAWILPSFVRQRVDFTQHSPVRLVDADGNPVDEEEAAARNLPPKRSLRETFSIVRHNRYFIANSIASFITVFSPDMGDELMIYRYLMPKIRVFGTEMSGEGLLPVKQLFAGTLSNVMKPFQRQIINKLGGPLRAQQLKCLVNIVCKVMMYLVGYKSLWRFAALVVFETFINASVDLDQVAEAMLNYEWYDYVELKTGERSEGVTSAIDGLFKKSVTNNIGQVTGNAFLQWTGYKGGYTQDGTRPPQKYLNFMWPMYTLIPVLDHTIWLVCRSLVRWKPEDRERTEQALAERRALIQEEIAAEKG